MRIRRFEDIEGWQVARQLMNHTYALTSARGFETDWDLRRQMRRASVSAIANIAEGFQSGTHPEFARFLRFAQRSTGEIQSHLYVALDQTYIEDPAFESLYALSARTSALIGGFIRFLDAGGILAPSSKPLPRRIHPNEARSTRNEPDAG